MPYDANAIKQFAVGVATDANVDSHCSTLSSSRLASSRVASCGMVRVLDETRGGPCVADENLPARTAGAVEVQTGSACNDHLDRGGECPP